MKIIVKYLLVICCICCPFASSFGQKQYEIDISNQTYTLQRDFLKMGTNKSPNGDVLAYNSLYLVKNNQPWFPIMGEMHFSRVAESDWESSILKMKTNGIQIISSYIFWNHHEEKQGIFNWKDNNNLKKFLSLCKKHNMYVWLRPGPWVHAEAHYGGFPNWLIDKKIALRSNDQTYLKYCDLFFKAIAQQINGFYFKNGGPIIGVQIENEYAFKALEKYEHMKTLKRMLIAAGFDVPYYSAFSSGPDNQDEFLYMLGSYPDSPWAQHTKKMFKPMFFIKQLEGDSDIGSDLFGQVDTKVRNTYPKLSAELGSGMQVTYHRRVVVSPNDVVGTAFVKVASGLNGLGYYMFHGGVNPVGETTLQESRETNYPNDVPIKNYDFQSPVGAMGLLPKSYNEFRLFHLFLNDFGSQLAKQKAFFPSELVKSYFSYDTVQTSIRVHDNSGFIFLSNYQRFVNLDEVNSFQLTVIDKNSTEKVPSQPVKFAANSFSIWPYNLKINKATLHYATAQPLCIIANPQQKTFVFFGDGECEFVFDSQNVREIKKAGNTKVTSDNRYFKVAMTGSDESFDVVDTENQSIRIVLLSRGSALKASKVKMNNQELLILSDANVTSQNNQISIEDLSDNGIVDLRVYPSTPSTTLTALSKSFTIKTVDAKSIFNRFTIAPNEPAKGNVSFVHDKSAYPIKEAERLRDSVLAKYAQGKYFNASQPGPIYQYNFKNLPEQNLYRLNFKVNQNANIKNWVLNMHYAADVMALYKNKKLAYDQFNYNNNCAYKLNESDFEASNQWLLQLSPFKANYDIYVEDDVKPDKEKAWNRAILNSAELKPSWQYNIKLNNK
ncbi:beta-galactosidase [Pedobacter endophyticus]|uniref:Beta-galactosidase n=1 Tax=Pedobacter endophyticus TaxID=2789740 RepID=A0A7S9KY63_9SPHI|nr:beta-galactosidase [Pedobacter endophyticus]QPH38985.1 beta-galactosidase [Pedobacter endophyticus]